MPAPQIRPNATVVCMALLSRVRSPAPKYRAVTTPEPAPAPAPGAELPAVEPAPAPGGPVDPVAAVCGKLDLTSREREILGLLYDGCTNQEIAERLFISEGTVKTHAHNIFRKTGCANRVQLLRLVADARER